MRSFIAIVALGAVAGCTATPDLEYASGDGAPGTDSDGGAGDATVPHDGGSQNDAAPGKDSSTPPIDSGGGVDSAIPCTAPDAAGVGCCPNGNVCVGDSCANCNDCIKIKCKPNDFCCPTYSGGHKYKNSECKPTPAC